MPIHLEVYVKKVFAAAAVAAGLSLALAPSASADNQSFLYELTHTPGYSFQGTPISFVTWGYAICADENNGFSRDQIIRNVINANPALDVASGLFVVQAAEKHLC